MTLYVTLGSSILLYVTLCHFMSLYVTLCNFMYLYASLCQFMFLMLLLGLQFYCMSHYVISLTFFEFNLQEPCS